MKLINQSAEFLPQEAGLSGIYKQIELAGRTSYLSWDKMTDDSAKKFVDMLIKSKHLSVLEHGTVYLTYWYPRSVSEEEGLYWEKPEVKIATGLFYKYKDNPYSKQICLNPVFSQPPYGHHNAINITTNLRVLQENGWLDDLKYLCEPTEFHEKRLSVRLTTSIDITRESNRNRASSPTEESTRYCNYSKGKYGSSISIGVPSWIDEKEIPTYKGLIGFADDISNGRTDRWNDLDWWCFANLACEKSYMMLLEKGWTPQKARKVLPLDTKSEIVYTAFESDWRDWFDKRLFGKTGEPHPDMLVLANLIKQEFEKAGIWEDIMNKPSKFDLI